MYTRMWGVEARVGVRELAAILGAVWVSAAARADTVWFVRASAGPGGDGLSFATAFSTLDEALVAAASGDEIRVAAGTYVPSVPGDRTSTFTLKAGVRVFGGFAGDNDAFESRDAPTYLTVLSGDRVGDDEPTWINRDDNCTHVVTASDPAIGASTVLDGFIITGGNADGPDLRGGGLLVTDCGPTVVGCTFIEHAAVSPKEEGSGGAVCVVGTGAAISARFESCRFESSQATYGGAVSVSGGGARVEMVGCVFIMNVAGAGGAVHAGAGAAADIALCRFIANSSVVEDGGAVLNAGGAVRIASSEIGWNTSARRGGGVHSACCGETRLTGCTLVGNFALMRAGGVRVDAGGSAFLHNCILSDNSDMFGLGEGAQVHLENGSAAADVQSCLVTGWTGALGGSGNFDAPAGFLDPEGADMFQGSEDDNYQLAAGSACVESGDDSLVPPDWADADGDGDRGEAMPFDGLGVPRAMDGDFNGFPRTDRGAYEYRCAADFDVNNFVNGDDFDLFVEAFEAGSPKADFDRNGFVNGDDFDGFAARFEGGC